MTNQFEGLRADLQQQYAVVESLRQQLSHEMRQSAMLQQQQQHLAAMHQSQLAEVNAAHASEIGNANAKIDGLLSQVRQLSIEKSACQAQLMSQQAANAQQARQAAHLTQLLQYTQSQLTAASTPPSAAAGALAEQVEQLKQQLQEAQQEAIRAERRCLAYQAQLAVEISKLEQATIAHKGEYEANKNENVALRAELEAARTELNDLQKQVAESQGTWESTGVDLLRSWCCHQS